MDFIKDFSLKDYNTFNIEATAKSFYSVSTIKELLQLLEQEKFNPAKDVILGGGSNILFKNNVEGKVIHNKILGRKIVDENSSEIFIEFFGGENWDGIVNYCVENNYSGIENLSLIPGTVGAAPLQNIGAYGVELKDVFHSCEVIELSTGITKRYSLSDCEFQYRSSIFKTKLRHQIIITKVILKLQKKHKLNIEYKPLKEKVDELGISNPTITDIRNIVCGIRNSKLPDPKEFGNAGSFFKNPIINSELLANLKKTFQEIKYYKIEENNYKIPAAWLIENTGLKGLTKGNVGTYDKHALIVINKGEATGKEIYRFSQLIIEKVKNKFGIELIPEVNII